MNKFVLVALLLLSACSEEFSEMQLVGNYVADYRGQTATLRLKNDNTYVHTINLSGGQAIVQESTWNSSKVTSEDTRTVVQLSNFRVIPSFGDAQPVSWATEVDSTWLGQT